MFFIKVEEVTTNDPMIFPFSNNLFASGVELFHASLAFFEDSRFSMMVGLHCYFCSENLVVTDNRTLSSLRFQSDHLNSNGFGLRLKISYPRYHYSNYMEGCTATSEQLKEHKIFLASFKQCYSLHLIAISMTQPRANFSFDRTGGMQFERWLECWD